MVMSAELPHEQGLNGAVVRQVKAERAASGMTVEQLASLSDMGARSLIRYLNFERPLTLEMIDKLAAGLGMRPEVLLTRAVEERQGQRDGIAAG